MPQPLSASYTRREFVVETGNVAYDTPIMKAVLLLLAGGALLAQGSPAPTNDLPNPYQTVADYFKLPAGRAWGSTSAVEIDKDGRSVWVAERCGANSCADAATGAMSPLDP